MSFPELAAHPERNELMSIAFTYRRGTNDGEYLKNCNPEYHRQVKTAQDAVKKAQGS